MLESRPPRNPGTLFGISLIVCLVLVDLGFIILLVSQPPSILSILWTGVIIASLPALAFLAFWVSSLATTRYHVEDGALVIEWGRIRQVIRLDQIRSLTMGEDVEDVKRFRGIRWPGYFVGRGQLVADDTSLADRDILVFATRPLQSQLILTTASNAYGLSPTDLTNFADCLEALRIPQQGEGGGAADPDLAFLAWPIWKDRIAQLVISAAILLNAAQFAYLASIFGRLPVSVPVHFNYQGIVDRMASPGSLFVLPLIGFLAWIVDGALGWIFYQLRKERAVAYLLWGAAILVQLISWIALLGLLATT